jgi:primary-amine oxidase
VKHPLDPLSGAEIERAAAAVRRERGDGAERDRFVFVDLHEPDKAELRAWRDGDAPSPARAAFVVLLDPVANATWEATVELGAGRVTALREVPDVQPAITAQEYAEAEQAVKRDPGYLSALAARGIDDPELVMVDAWTVGDFEDPTVRAARGLSWLRADLTGDNGYARPLGQLVAVVDLNTMAVVRIDDHGALAVPRAPGDYRDGGGRPYRDQRPLDIVQPEGPTFALDGRLLRWSNWRLRVGFNAREGLVLHEVGWEQDGAVRSVMHRGSLAELVVPYGDPNPTVHFKGAFDVGEFGLGPLLNALELGCDCLGEIRYLDGEIVTDSGAARVLPNAICIHEEDAGLLWKHSDHRAGRVDQARSRRLVVSCIATVGNYEYGLFWRLYQDGTIEAELQLTGVMHTAGVAEGSPQAFATLIARDVAAPNHQHFFTFRLDLDVDGEANRVCEVEAEPQPPGHHDPDGIAFSTRRTVLRSESEARRTCDPLRARRWRIENTARSNHLGEPVAYELVPGANVLPMQAPGSSIRRRARFLDHHLWVTPYRREERFPAGDYPNQHPGGDGLPRWTAADRQLEGADVVLWYTLGEHHVPRLEDWPVMPVARLGFQLRPVGFFDRNPALDVPPPQRR